MTTGFTPADTAAILWRDGDRCSMCGRRATTANHRANRGSGGHRGSNRLSNGCAICWRCNGDIESDAGAAERARERGVKLSRYDDPTAVPYFHPLYQLNVWLDDAGGFTFDPPAPTDPATVPTLTQPPGNEKAPSPKTRGRAPTPTHGSETRDAV